MLTWSTFWISVFFGLGCIRAWLYSGLIAYCLGMHTASECILPRNAYCLGMHSAAGCIQWPGQPPGRPPGRPAASPLINQYSMRPGGRAGGRAAECIRRPNAFGGRMHSEAVCIPRQYAIKAECNQARMQSISLLPIAYCPRKTHPRSRFSAIGYVKKIRMLSVFHIGLVESSQTL